MLLYYLYSNKYNIYYILYLLNKENDFNKNKPITNLIRESQYNLRNLKNLNLKNNKSKELNLSKPVIRYNSCSTLLIDNTITTADMDDTLKWYLNNIKYFNRKYIFF